MTRKLSDADRAAIDLIFDRLTATAGGNGNGGSDYVASTPSVDERRLSAVEQIVKPLDALPTHEPPADLAIRTLQRIARATRTNVPTAPGHYIDPSQPMA